MRGVGKGAWRRVFDYPFELTIALVSLLPPLVLGLDDDLFVTGVVVRQLERPFDVIWAIICIGGGLSIMYGLITNNIPPLYVGLRMTSLGWGVFCYLCVLMLPDPKPHINLFALAAAVIIGMSLCQASRLAKRYKSLRRAAAKLLGE